MRDVVKAGSEDRSNSPAHDGLVPGGIALTTRFEQEPGTPLGLEDPDLYRAGNCDVMVPVAHFVGGA